MILAAGMGTRLQPLTDNKPKALVEAGGVPLLEIVISRLKQAGFTDLVVNIHHFGEQILEFLSAKQNFGLSIQISDEREMLLDTGGGIKHAAQYFENQPVLVHNVDVLTTLDIQSLVTFHQSQTNAIATMAVKDRDTSRSLLLDNEHNLAGWRNNQTGETKISHGKVDDLSPIAFSCVHILNPECIELLSETGAFSIMDAYLRLAKTHRIATFAHSDLWMDMGRVEHLKQAEPFVPQLIAL